MGGNSSKEGDSFPAAPSLWRSNHSDSRSTHDQEYHSYAYVHGGQTCPHGQPSMSYAPPQQNYPQQYYTAQQAPAGDKRRLERRYSRIGDDYNSLEQVTEALARAGLESSNLIVGIDFTKSNEWTGARSFNRKSLHHIGDNLNPYEQAISIIGKTLATFDDDNLIPCYGFGDASTHDQDVFSFYPDRHCHGFEEVLSRYKEIVPQLLLSGPTSFSPIIEMAMTIVKQSRGQYHVLLIIADGQVTRSIGTQRGQLSPQEQKTIDAIVQASNLPLSIILVGVGDGPWDVMKEFDDNIPARAFDNFQFVNFTEIMSKNIAHSRKETEFALAALMEIPSQYKATIEFKILGTCKEHMPERVPLHPPMYGPAAFGNSKSFSHSSVGSSKSSGTSAFSSSKSFATSLNTSKHYYSTSFEPTVPTDREDSRPVSAAPPATNDSQLCAICLSNEKDMAFGCGHQTCADCSKDLQTCPMCRSSIKTRIKLYL